MNTLVLHKSNAEMNCTKWIFMEIITTIGPIRAHDVRVNFYFNVAIRLL